MDRARARWQWDRDPGRGAWRLAGGRGDDRRRRWGGVSDRRPYARPGRLRTCGDRRAGRVRSERAGGAGRRERSGRIRRCGRSRRRGARGPWRRIPGAQHGAVRGGRRHRRDAARRDRRAADLGDGSGGVRRLAVDRRDHASALRGRRQSAVRSGRDGIPADVGSGCGVVASDGDAVHGTQYSQQPQTGSGRTGPEQPVHWIRNRARRRPPRRRGGTRPARRPDRSFGSFGTVGTVGTFWSF